MKTIIQQWSVDWAFFWKAPPEGLPKRLAVEHLAAPDRHGAREGQLARLYSQTLRQVPSGYGLCWARIDPPPKRRTTEQMARQRKAAMEKRIREQHPLFAEELIARELSEKPAYYAGEKDNTFRDQCDSEDQALFEKMETADLEMKIFHPWWEAKKEELTCSE
jgi:hypothetical protein